jgi:hypothetical protein
MVVDALRAYMQLASGLTDVTRQRALAAAKQMIDQGGEVVDQMASATTQASAAAVRRQAAALAEELIATSRLNRDLLVGLVRAEVERAVERLGLLSDRDEVVALNHVVERLQAQLDAAIAFGATTARQASSRRPGKKAGGKPAGSGDHATKANAAKTAKTAKTAKAAKAAKPAVAAKKAAAKKPAKAKSAAKKSTAKKTSAKLTAAKHAPVTPAPASPAIYVATLSQG